MILIKTLTCITTQLFIFKKILLKTLIRYLLIASGKIKILFRERSGNSQGISKSVLCCNHGVENGACINVNFYEKQTKDSYPPRSLLHFTSSIMGCHVECCHLWLHGWVTNGCKHLIVTSLGSCNYSVTQLGILPELYRW